MDEGYTEGNSWFEDHYLSAPQQIVDFLGGDGLSIENCRVADIGTGDGILALGLFNLANPKELVGYDLQAIDVEHLSAVAHTHGVGDLPNGLSFEISQPDRIPAESGQFDFVVSWSAFEHIEKPTEMAREIRRILAPGGVAMIQLFPFYFSEHGDHGWERSSFEHLVSGQDRENVYLNRITLDGLHEALRTGGLRVAKVELIHFGFHVPPTLDDFRLSDLAIGGVKIAAVAS